MRVFSKHGDLAAIARGAACLGIGDTPALTITLEFLLRDGTLAPLKVFGMLDTGASMTIIPGYRVGLSSPIGSRVDSLGLAEQADTSTLAGQMDFQPVSLSGVLGTGRVPGYTAYVSIGGRRLNKAILVGAVVGQWYPLIGRDVANEFIVTVDPWRNTSALANKASGKLLSFVTNGIKGRCVAP